MSNGGDAVGPLVGMAEAAVMMTVGPELLKAADEAKAAMASIKEHISGPPKEVQSGESVSPQAVGGKSAPAQEAQR